MVRRSSRFGEDTVKSVRAMYRSRCRLATPHTQRVHAFARLRFRQVPFRSPLLRELCFFLGVHEMFQFPRLPPTQRWVTQVALGRVAPLGDDGLKA
jgi:hypothetical protein